MAAQKALWLPGTQGKFEVGPRDIPKPGPGELLVKIFSTALNPVDWKIHENGWFVDSYPTILGTDSAGEVEEVGEGVTTLKKGDRVFHQGWFSVDKATFQQYTLVPAEISAKIPDNISFDQAASIPLGVVSAAVGLYSKKEIGAGHGLELTPPWEEHGLGKYANKAIFITGGASSVGQYTLQFAKLSGFSPIIVTASLSNTSLLTSLGATHVIDRKLSDDETIAAATKIAGGPIRFAYDAIASAATQQLAYDVVAPSGDLVITLPSVIKEKEGKNVHVAYFTGNVHLPKCRDLGVRLFAHLSALLSEGTIKPNRTEVLPDGLAGIPDGLWRLKENKVSGVKLIARPQETA